MAHVISIEDLGSWFSHVLASSVGGGVSKSIRMDVEMIDGVFHSACYVVSDRKKDEYRSFNTIDVGEAIEAYNAIQ